MSLFLLLCGGNRVRVPREHRTRVADLCLSRGYAYTDFTYLADGSVSFSLSARAAKALLRDAAVCGLTVEVISEFGLPPFLLRLCRRPGLLIGGVLGLLLLFLSCRFLWAVEVTGNETLGAGEVEQLLAECGFGVGSYLPDVDVRALENRVLIETDRIGWISINLRGTVAHVQVVERREAGQDPFGSGTAPAHLVAARDGQIEYFEILRGVRAVGVGQAVRAGEVLVSGVCESGTEGVPLYTRAAGRVLARTERVLEVEIPYAWEEKTYARGSVCSLSLNFFNFSLNFFENSGNVGQSCDIIEAEKVLPTLGKHPIPVSLSLKRAMPYTLVSRTRDEQAAVALAYTALGDALAELSSDVTLLSRDVLCTVGEQGVRLVCTLSCVEDIARVQEIGIGE